MSQLDLLMAHADTGEPVLAKGLTEQAAGGQLAPEDKRDPLHLWDEADSANNLESQRWGVIIPDTTEGKRLLQIIDPLVKARSAAQGGRPVVVYTTPAKMDNAQAVDWKRQMFDSGKTTSQDLPRYLLILGDLDQVPLSIQQVQSADAFVGRLAFDNDEGYAGYVDKILRWEKKRSALTQARSMMFTVHDQTAATDSGYRALVAPGLEVQRTQKSAGQFNASEILELGSQDVPSPNELLAAGSGPDPAMLFTLSHGLGAPRAGWRSKEEQRRLQGAMSFGSEGRLTAEEFAGKPFLPGGVWFMLACYGAGTPDRSAYHQWLSELQSLGQFRGQPDSVLAGLPKPEDRPFIAALPKAVLSNPNGPLSFMGHVDLAWTYSFAELDSGKADSKPGRFMDILRFVLRGDRVGVAFHELLKFFGRTNTYLTSLQSNGSGVKPSDPKLAAQLGHLWMLRQDLAGYVLLGDPAAQLPLQPKAVVNREKTVQELADELFPFKLDIPSIKTEPSGGATGTTGQSTAASTQADAPPPALPLPIERLEDAISRLLSGDGAKQVALDYQLEKNTLQRLFELYRRGGRRALGIKE